jgi:FAD/FMN-containing dehydrogenase
VNGHCIVGGMELLGGTEIHLGISVGPQTRVLAHEIEAMVYEPLPDYGGAVSAEHGIGQFKRVWLERRKSDGEKDAMRHLRQAMDPQRLHNPDVMR